jgi:hypothetical protein
MRKVLQGRDTFLHWRRAAASDAETTPGTAEGERTPERAEALWRLAEGLARRGSAEERREALLELARLPVRANPRAGELLVHLIGVGEEEAVRGLLEAGVDANASLQDGSTALHAAAFRGLTGLVRELARAGADLNAESSDGETALGAAVKWMHTGTAAALLDLGARASDEDRRRLAAVPENEFLFSGIWPVSGAAVDERGAVYWYEMGDGRVFVLEPGSTGPREIARVSERQLLRCGLDAAAGTVYALEQGAMRSLEAKLVALDAATGGRRILAEGSLAHQTLCANASGEVCFTGLVERWARGYVPRVFALDAGSSEPREVAELERRPAGSAFTGPGRVAFSIADYEKGRSRIVELRLADGTMRRLAELDVIAGTLYADRAFSAAPGGARSGGRAGSLYVAGRLPGDDRGARADFFVLRVRPGRDIVRLFRCPWPWCMAVSPGGEALYAGFGDGTFRRIEIPRRQRRELRESGERRGRVGPSSSRPLP